MTPSFAHPVECNYFGGRSSGDRSHSLITASPRAVIGDENANLRSLINRGNSAMQERVGFKQRLSEEAANSATKLSAHLRVLNASGYFGEPRRPNSPRN